MRAIYNLKTINFESSAPIIKKIVGTYFSFLFILFLITALICLNNFKQIFLEEHAIKITIIISITFILISCILILILWIILKKIISPLIKLVTHSKNSDSLHEIEIPENISSEIIELYKITNESIARINEYQSKKIENEKNMAIAMTTQMLAHDVRKLFYLLKTTLKLLSQTKDPSKINDLINETIPEIDRTIKKVEGLLKDILEIGRTDGNLILAAIDPESFIKSIIKENMYIYNRSNINFSFYFQHKHMFHIHPAKMERVFSNILTNAMQAMNFQGNIWIHSKEIIFNTKEYIEFCIGNNNSYISNENTKKVFNKFYTQKQNGTGLGLAIVENLIKEHNGNIYCTSEKNSQYPEGKVEFWFTLPVAKGYLKLNKKSLGESYVESGK